MMDKRKLDSAVDKSLVKSGGLHQAEPGLMAGWLSNRVRNFKCVQ